MPLSRYIRYLWAAAAAFSLSVFAGPAVAAAVHEKATWPDGRQREGTLQIAASGDFVFAGASSEPAAPLESLRQIDFPLAPGAPEPAPFRVQLWSGDVIAARAVFIEKTGVKLVLDNEREVRVDRGALASIVSRRVADGSLDAWRLGTQQDQVVVSDGDQIFGQIEAMNQQQLAIRGTFGLVRIPANRLRGMLLRRGTPVGRPIEGVLVQVRLRNGEQAADDEVLQGTLVGAGSDLLELDHSLLGRLHLTRARARSLQVLGKGRYVPIDSAAYHLGNDVRSDFLLPQPEGSELSRAFMLDETLPEPVFLICTAHHMEGMGKESPFADELRNGHLRTQLWINDHQVDYFNRHVRSPSEQQQRFRIELPAGLLKQGRNKLRITQTPLPYNETDFDDLVLSGLAIETSGRHQ